MKKASIYIILFIMTGILNNISLGCDECECSQPPPGDLRCIECYPDDSECYWDYKYSCTCGFWGDCGSQRCCVGYTYYYQCNCNNCCGESDCPGQHCCNGTCYECCNDWHCAAQGKVCDLVNHQCVPCNDTDHTCPYGQVCNNGVCVECIGRDCSGCIDCCLDHQCRTCKCTPELHYAHAVKSSLTNVYGVEARIETRFDTRLCGIIPTELTQAASAAYVDAFRENRKWAQAGLIHVRGPRINDTGTYSGTYIEVWGDDPHLELSWEHNIDPPEQGTFWQYGCTLDKTTGTWYCNAGYFILPITDNYWRDKSCIQVDWEGEIHNLEDDMVGTPNDHCSFVSCRFAVEGQGWQDAGLTTGSIIGVYPPNMVNEWGIELTGTGDTSFDIWDKKPL